MTVFIFILYLLIMLFIGIWTYRFNETHEDYLLAGRKLGPWVTAFSERASGESAWLLLALPGAAIAVGLGEIWTVLGITIGIIVSWFLIPEKLRAETEKYGALTIPEYLHRRFNDHSNFIRLFSTIIITFFFAFYVSAQFHASGKILNSMFGIDKIIGIMIGASVIVIYTLMGGFLAVAWTDLIQGILMIGTLIVLPIAGFIELQDSPKTMMQALESAGPTHSSLVKGKEGLAAFGVIIGGLSWGLGYLGQPHLIIRYMAIRSVEEVKRARTIAIAWAIPGITGAFMIGLVALNYFGSEYFETIDVEHAMPLLAKEIFPAMITGLFISGAVAAMMSTADSQLLVTTSAITEDLIHQILGKKLSSKRLVLLSRISIVLLGLFALVIAVVSEKNGKNIFSVVSYAWSGLGSAFGPALVLTLWWKETTRKGIIAGLVTGFFSTIIWASIPTLNNLITERLISFILAFTAVVIFSLLDKKSGFHHL